ncbi:MAG TPA: EamA family transporter [Bacteroidales bacterium]|nr:EamA family transporter [Bacteroidales bacterium]
MSWFFFAILTAFFRSLTDVAGKVGLKNMDEYIVAWSLFLFALPFIALLLIFEGIPKIGDDFWIALLIGGGANILTNLLYMRAIKVSDLSITIPLVTFTPLFMLITSPLILGEFPNIYGLAGIVLIVAGSYILNFKESSKGYLAPFKALVREKGPRLMLLVAFIWSITANLDKIGIQNSSVFFWPVAVNTFITIGFIPVVLIRSKGKTRQITTNLRTLVPIGLFHGLMIVFQMVAVSMTLVAYVISIKRTSAVISVVLGSLVFKEAGLRERLTGSIIMIAGVLLITLMA